MKRDGTESCPLPANIQLIKTGVPRMTMTMETGDVCCVALELSKTNWVCAFSVPGDGKGIVHKIKAGDVEG